MANRIRAMACTPSVVFNGTYDSFTDTNGVTLNNHIGENYASWVSPDGAISTFPRIFNNSVLRGASNRANFYTDVSGITDYEVTASFTYVSGAWSNVGLYGRAAIGGNRAWVRVLDGNRIELNINGFSTYSFTWGAGETHIIKLTCVGDVYTVFLNGTQILQRTTSAGFANGNYAGFENQATSDTAGNHMNDFLCRKL